MKNIIEMYNYLNDPKTKLLFKSNAKINPFACACQFAHETGQFKSAPFNNMAGIKGTKGWISRGGKIFNANTKEEYVAGVMSNINASFRAYDTLDDFIMDYTDIIGRLYPICNENHDNYIGYFYGLVKGGWATDFKYFVKLCKMADSYVLDLLKDKDKTRKAAELFIERFNGNQNRYSLQDKNKQDSIIDYVKAEYIVK